MLGIFGYALFSSFFFLALTGLSASLTVLLLYTYPVMVMILSHYILKEYITKSGVLALITVTIGMILLVWGEWSVSNPSYLLFGIGAAFFYALYIIYSHRYLKNTPALPSSFYVQLGAGVILSLIHFSSNPQRPFNILSEHFIFIVSMAILCSLMAMSLFLAGLQKITSTEASILSTTEPISGVIIATILLHEKISVQQMIGGFLILLGMILCARRKT
jgi:drug/metabolite transporter (DMT)-like permease